MSDRQEPDWDAMANQRLNAYLDSCDPVCEDCECEDPEHPEVGEGCECHNGHRYNNTVCMWCWNRGRRKWGDPEVPEDTLCECKCHNIPRDPRDDRPEPDDIPDWYPEGD